MERDSMNKGAHVPLPTKRIPAPDGELPRTHTIMPKSLWTPTTTFTFFSNFSLLPQLAPWKVSWIELNMKVNMLLAPNNQPFDLVVIETPPRSPG